MQSEFELLDGFREMGEMLLRIEKRICRKKSSDKSNEEINSKINTNKNDTTNLTDSSSNLMKRNNLDCVIDVVDDKVKEINHINEVQGEKMKAIVDNQNYILAELSKINDRIIGLYKTDK